MQSGLSIKRWLLNYKKAETPYSLQSPFLKGLTGFVFDGKRTYYDFALLDEWIRDWKIKRIKIHFSDEQEKEKAVLLHRLLGKAGVRERDLRMEYRLVLYFESQSIMVSGSPMGISPSFLQRVGGQVLWVTQDPNPIVIPDAIFRPPFQPPRRVQTVALRQPSSRNIEGCVIHANPFHPITAANFDLMLSQLNNRCWVAIFGPWKNRKKIVDQFQEEKTWDLSLQSVGMHLLIRGHYDGEFRDVYFMRNTFWKPWHYLYAL